MRKSSVETIIIETLSRRHAHLTSLQIFDAIRDQLPAVNQSTIYRALERLVHNGRVSVSDMGTGSAVYERMSDQMHHHLVCQKCGQILTIDHEDVEGFFSLLEEKTRYKILTNHLVLFGICKACKNSGEFNDPKLAD